MSTTPVSESIIDKIQALLAKAESTQFGPEAESLVAKAQELITRHNLDEVALAAERGIDTGTVIKVEIPFTSTNSKAKGILLHQIAKANRCTSVRDNQNKIFFLFGFKSDVTAVQGLYNTLLVVAAHELLVEKRLERPDRPSVFARNFHLGFAVRIGERLKEQNAQAERDATVASPGTGLVLVARDKLVKQSVTDAFGRGRVRSSSSRISDGRAFKSGQAAGSRASLNASVGGRTARSLGA